MLSDLDIAHSQQMRPVREIAHEIGVPEEYYEPYGRYKAKLSLRILGALADRPLGRYVVVTAITPTPLGEGKTVTTIGLGQALKRIGKTAFTCMRQPSLGPVFGIKGGAAGGGYSQVLPMEDINLHLTGDIHAVGAAHNLLRGVRRQPHPPRQQARHRPHDHPVAPRRRHQRPRRSTTSSSASAEDGVPRANGLRHHASPASSWRYSRSPRTSRTCAGASAASSSGRTTTAARDRRGPQGRRRHDRAHEGHDQAHPLQTIEGGPVFVHAGPFGNIAHGNSSIIADRIGDRASPSTSSRKAGFGADMGFEKFFNIKCRVSGLIPDVVVLVATHPRPEGPLRPLRGQVAATAARPALTRGPRTRSRRAWATSRQIENVRSFGVSRPSSRSTLPDRHGRRARPDPRGRAARGPPSRSRRHARDGGGGGLDAGRGGRRGVRGGGAVPAHSTRTTRPSRRRSRRSPRASTAPTASTTRRGAERRSPRYERLGFGGLPGLHGEDATSLSADPRAQGRARAGGSFPSAEVALPRRRGLPLPARAATSRPCPACRPNRPENGIDLDETASIVGLS